MSLLRREQRAVYRVYEEDEYLAAEGEPPAPQASLPQPHASPQAPRPAGARPPGAIVAAGLLVLALIVVGAVVALDTGSGRNPGSRSARAALPPRPRPAASATAQATVPRRLPRPPKRLRPRRARPRRAVRVAAPGPAFASVASRPVVAAHIEVAGNAQPAARSASEFGFER